MLIHLEYLGEGSLKFGILRKHTFLHHHIPIVFQVLGTNVQIMFPCTRQCLICPGSACFYSYKEYQPPVKIGTRDEGHIKEYVIQ